MAKTGKIGMCRYVIQYIFLHLAEAIHQRNKVSYIGIIAV